jgi:predicted kinase
VVVSGPPGSGKTTLAHALAQAVPCPAICRDEIKEGMAHAQGADFQGGHGDPLTQRTLPLFFEVLHVLIAAGVSLVAEAAFQDRLWRPQLEPLARVSQLRIVRCRVDAAVSFERAGRRAATNESRAKAHGDSTLGKAVAEWARAVESFEHISMSAPSIDVDTTNGYKPNLGEILAFVNRAEARHERYSPGDEPDPKARPGTWDGPSAL